MVTREEFVLEDGSHLEVIRWNNEKGRDGTGRNRILWSRDEELERKMVHFSVENDMVIVDLVSIGNKDASPSTRSLPMRDDYNGMKFPLENFTYPDIFITLDALGAFDG